MAFREFDFLSGYEAGVPSTARVLQNTESGWCERSLLPCGRTFFDFAGDTARMAERLTESAWLQ